MTTCGVTLLWNDNAETILKKADLLIQTTKAEYHSLIAVPVNKITFNNTIKKVNYIDQYFSSKKAVLNFYRHAHPDKSIRDASEASSKLLSDFDIEYHVKQDIYNRAYSILCQNYDNDVLSIEDKCFIQRIVKFGKQNGLHLSHATQAKIKKLDKRIAEITIKFQDNLRQDQMYLSVTAEDLDGMSEEFINSLPRDDSQHFKLFLKYRYYFPVMTQCHQAYTRKAMEESFHKRCKLEHMALIVELINWRHKRAKLLGFDSHVSYVVSNCMAKYTDNIQQFLSELTDRIRPLGKRNLKRMLRLKEAEMDSWEHYFDGRINMWDIRYYAAQSDDLNFSLNKEEFKQYFPLDAVISGLLKLVEDLFQLKFELISNAPVWHVDVKLYKIMDVDQDVEIGQIYIDLLYRRDKYPHLASFCLIPGCVVEDGSRQNAVTALIGNFPTLPNDKEPFLYHEDVQNLFHEFGQILQFLLSETKYEAFSRGSIEKDFSTIPSLIFEYLSWEVEPLQRISRHCKDETILPLNSIESLAKSRNSNKAIFYLRQILLATLDINLHTNPALHIEKEYNALCKQILGIPPTRSTFMPASFSHLVNGYDATYYSYLWSRVYSFDMFRTKFKVEGLMNPKVWSDYRREILAPGGGLDSHRKFVNFMGRQPCVDAFLDFLELSGDDLTDNLYYRPTSVNFSDLSLDASSSQFQQPRSVSEMAPRAPQHESTFHKVQSFQSVFKPPPDSENDAPKPSQNEFDDLTEF